MSSGTILQQALSLVESADLEHTEHQLLTLFIEDAVDPARPAKYVLDRGSAGGASSREHSLRLIKNDWRRLLARREHPLDGYFRNFLSKTIPC
ncbi:hypothetical protein AJ79_03693 [Helicocarpus griseus UAMH5409]|uniref:Uncharacterized protein n=1 Tax=Helicocarpus griseus UAMH5409 TaxID=1447875 RepID=A0A2B7XNS1_9EURO|nr:hypothetical protein AJ79_03693 [Helicocarpus griseus UAMH5409]